MEEVLICDDESALEKNRAHIDARCLARPSGQRRERENPDAVARPDA
jgi:hypothetical protein